MTTFFKDKNKASVLEACAGMLRHGVVLPQISFTVAEWRDDRSAIQERLARAPFADQALIVRSSAVNEDLASSSMAGRFLSVLNVQRSKNFNEAVDQVVASFAPRDDRHVVFIQPQLQNAKLAGVAFTAEKSSGAPYYVIDLVRSSDTTSVTGGRTNDGRTVYVHREKTRQAPAEVVPLLALCRELEELTGNDRLDIEFAIGQAGEIYLLQVRPMATARTAIDRGQQQKALEHAETFYRRISAPNVFVHGQRTILGVMPDWNPAEIIGVKPRPLAFSLYKEFITDRIWAYQRDKYGYHNLRSVPLMYSIAGCPYIDVRASFNSFVPKTLSSSLKTRIVDYYLDQLEKEPELHDKVEFEIIHSCYVPSTPSRLRKLVEHGFSDRDVAELEVCLRNLTNDIIHADTGHWRTDIGKIDVLKRRQLLIQRSDLDPYSQIYWLTEDCKRYGTLPFAGLARAGFIANQFLHSLCAENLLTLERHSEFMASLETVGSRLKNDLSRLPREAFMERYGHLRPGTYDIESLRYDEAPESYFDWSAALPQGDAHMLFELSPLESARIEQMLETLGINHTPESLFRFFKDAIEGREMAKFVFTWSISEILRILSEIGSSFGYDRLECSYLNFQNLISGYSYGQSIEDVFHREIEQGKRTHAAGQHVILPPLLRSAEDLWSFTISNSRPNYVTVREVEGEVIHLTYKTDRRDIDGKIVFITNADPGYDWMLATQIRGFVTCYGGPNSHMAIRAAELGLPAVIGAGERLFESWRSAKRVKIDCGNQRVTVLS